MSTNHYVRLGLHADGKSVSGAAYTHKEITKAYKRLARECHPDKTTGKRGYSGLSATKFAALVKSYDLLSNPETRAQFDRMIEENRPAYLDEDHLFFDLEAISAGLVPEENAVKYTREPFAITPRMNKGIDLTQLIVDTNYKPSALLKIVQTNPALGIAIIHNPCTFSLFSLEEQFKLVFIVVMQKESGNGDFTRALFESPTITHLIERLTAREAEFEEAFSAACTQHPAWTEPFLKQFAGKLKFLSQNTLFRISRTNVLAVTVLIEVHADSLTPIDVAYLLDQFPQRAASLGELYESCAGKQAFQRWDLYKRSCKALDYMAGNRTLCQKWLSHPRTREIFQGMGLAAAVSIRKKYNLLAHFDVASIFMDDCSIEEFKRRHPEQERNQCRNELIARLSVIDVMLSYKLFMLSYNPEDTKLVEELLKAKAIPNEPVAVFLLEQMTLPNVEDLIEDVRLASYQASFREKMSELIVTVGPDGKGQPYFLTLLLEKNRSALECLKHNHMLFATLLQNPLYQEAIAEDSELEKELAVALAIGLSASGDESVPHMEPAAMPPTFTARYKAALSLLQKIKKELPITYKEFQKDFEQTGFFDELIDILAADPRVKLELLCAYIARVDVQTDATQASIEFKGEKLFQIAAITLEKYNTDKDPTCSGAVEILVDSCNAPKIAQLLLAAIAYALKERVRVRYPHCFLLMRKLIEDVVWRKQYLTGRVATQWREAFQSSNMHTMLKPWKGFLGVSYAVRQLFPEIGSNKNAFHNNTPEFELKGCFERTCEAFEGRGLISDFPDSPFSNFLMLTKSEYLQEKAGQYQDLETHLQSLIKKRWETLDPNVELEAVLLLLEKTGVDNATIEFTFETLKRTHSDLLAATLEALVFDTRWKIPPGVQKTVNKKLTGLKITKPLELTFLKLAEIRVMRYRDALGADELVGMSKAHGEALAPCIRQYCSANLDVISQAHHMVASLESIGQEGFSQQAKINQAGESLVLLNQFKEVVRQLPFDPAQLTAPKKDAGNRQIYYQILSHKPDADTPLDPEFVLLSKSFSNTENNSLMDILIEMALSGSRFSQEQIKLFLSTPELASALVQQLYCLIESDQLTFELLEETFGGEAVDAVLSNYFTQLGTAEKISENVLSAAVRRADSVHLTVSEVDVQYGRSNRDKILSQVSQLSSTDDAAKFSDMASYQQAKFSYLITMNHHYVSLLALAEADMLTFDQINAIDIDNAALCKLYKGVLAGFHAQQLDVEIIRVISSVLAPQLDSGTCNSENIERLRGNLEDDLFDQLLVYLISQYPPNSEAPRFLFDAVYTTIISRGLTVGAVDQIYGVTIRNKVLSQATMLDYGADRFFTSSEEFEVTKFSSVLARCSRPYVSLLPFVDAGILTFPQINEIQLSDPMQRRVYSELLNRLEKSLPDDSSDRESVKTGIETAHKILQSDYYRDFLYKNIFSAMEKEIKRLKIEPDGKEKVEQIVKAKEEIANVVIVEMVNLGKGGYEGECNKLKMALHAKLNSIASRPKINKQRNVIKAFLKALAGILFAIPALGLPLIFRTYRDSIFHTSTRIAMDKMSKSIEPDKPRNRGVGS